MKDPYTAYFYIYQVCSAKQELVNPPDLANQVSASVEVGEMENMQCSGPF